MEWLSMKFFLIIWDLSLRQNWTDIPLQTFVGPSMDLLWTSFGPFSDHFRTFYGPLGPFLDPVQTHPEPFWTFFDLFRTLLGPLSRPSLHKISLSQNPSIFVSTKLLKSNQLKHFWTSIFKITIFHEAILSRFNFFASRVILPLAIKSLKGS